MNQQFSVGDKVRFVVNNHFGDWYGDRDYEVQVGSCGTVEDATVPAPNGVSVYVRFNDDLPWWFDEDELELIHGKPQEPQSNHSSSTEILRQSTVFNTDVLTVGSAVRIIGHSVEIEGETVEPSEDFECGVNGLISSVSSDKTRVVYIDPYGNQQVEYISIDEVINGLYTIELLK